MSRSVRKSDVSRSRPARCSYGPRFLSAQRRTSGLSTLNEDQIAERGARMARRDDREYREYLREEQRSQPGCPAREVVLDQRGQATSPPERHRCSGGSLAWSPCTARDVPENCVA